MNLNARTTERYLFSGHVQGVGFRWTTNRIAAGFSVLGFVRNLPDGRVELVVQGRRAEIDSLVEAVKSHFAAKIQSLAQEPFNEQENFACFEIRG